MLKKSNVFQNYENVRIEKIKQFCYDNKEKNAMCERMRNCESINYKESSCKCRR